MDNWYRDFLAEQYDLTADEADYLVKLMTDIHTPFPEALNDYIDNLKVIDNHVTASIEVVAEWIKGQKG